MYSEIIRENIFCVRVLGIVRGKVNGNIDKFDKYLFGNELMKCQNRLAANKGQFLLFPATSLPKNRNSLKIETWDIKNMEHIDTKKAFSNPEGRKDSIHARFLA